MHLLAAGDSFVWGSELADSPHGGPDGYSRKTFTALLASGYTCVAYPGLSNRGISQRVKEACRNGIYDVTIVSWTWPSRDDALTSDREIISLQEYLEYRQQPYLFTCADNCVVTNHTKIHWENWFLFPAGSKAHETCAPRGFYQWAVENKYPVGPQQHPLEQAHEDAATLIKDKLHEVVKKHLEQTRSRNSIS